MPSLTKYGEIYKLNFIHAFHEQRAYNVMYSLLIKAFKHVWS